MTDRRFLKLRFVLIFLGLAAGLLSVRLIESGEKDFDERNPAGAETTPTVDVTRAQADAVLVEKGRRRLTLLVARREKKSYRIALGGEPEGPKRCRGDNRTPEGRYMLDYRNANSKFYRAIHISYPNAEDLKRAKVLGCQPGGDVMIHGLPREKQWAGWAHSLVDWTQGCIAVSNREMDEIWEAVADGTPIEIRP